MIKASPIKSLICAGFGAIVFADPVLANPDGAPWGAADREAVAACHSCHWDAEPVIASDAITFIGAPDEITPGAVYDLTVRFMKPSERIAGMAIIARASDGVDAGGFETISPDIETNGNQARSTAPAAKGNVAEWAFRWRAPEQGVERVKFLIAANASNDDASPFGDGVHYQTIIVPSKDK